MVWWWKVHFLMSLLNKTYNRFHSICKVNFSIGFCFDSLTVVLSINLRLSLSSCLFTILVRNRSNWGLMLGFNCHMPHSLWPWWWSLIFLKLCLPIYWLYLCLYPFGCCINFVNWFSYLSHFVLVWSIFVKVILVNCYSTFNRDPKTDLRFLLDDLLVMKILSWIWLSWSCGKLKTDLRCPSSWCRSKVFILMTFFP